MSAPDRVDLLVIGSGYTGSLMAMLGRRLGYSVTLVERGHHPRFAIGESSTPIANLLLEEIADEFGLPFVRSFSKWGTWQREHPDIACGLKRGFTFYRHELGAAFPRDRAEALRRQLLVGASPNERIADTHWYRPDFDHAFLRHAQELGAAYFDDTALETVTEDDHGITVRGTRSGRPITFSAGFLIDATGQRGFLHRALQLSEKDVQGFPPTQALFSHFAGVGPLPDCFTPGEPPYPPEQAAVHHVFDGGWIWVLKFNNGITSAGVAALSPVAERFQLRAGEAGWRNLLRQLPSVAECFQNARSIVPFAWQPRVAFQSGVVTGQRWAMVPSAAGFVDPLLSTGFALALLGIQRLGRLLRQGLGPSFAAGLAEYARVTALEFETAAQLIRALYASLDRFDRFKDLTLLYFAAASFSETARRLGGNAPRPNFLLCDHPVFGPQLRELCASPDAALRERILAVIDPFDVAGLTEGARDPWYPALASDLLAHAAKVGASASEMSAMLTRSGIAGA